MSDTRTKTIHVTMDLIGGMKLKDRELDGVLIKDGRRLKAWEAREAMAELLRQGFEVIPVCDNHDAKGHCRGHWNNPDGTQTPVAEREDNGNGQ